MKVILKADDLAGYPGKDETVPKRWQKFVDIIEQYNIKANIGIIGNSLVFDDKAYFSWIQKYHNSDLIEFFNHGFLHRQFDFDGKEKYQEFCNTSKEYQLKLIDYTNKLAKEKLNIELVTFGAPYNAVDFNTSQALNLTNMKYGFFLKEGFDGINLTNTLELEVPTHIVNLEALKENFKQLNYAVIQIHPNSWDNKSFDNFKLAIEFLSKENIEFVFTKDI